ncbi:RagB/SusD family nutrient uptake outer membrane protein [Chitinophaga horti]|uniref:RagB/SusD family nutrient uptake outer membrane protein n=1 Tax=Chitinophaga horti TaxID=2920382 RepID=A0ABY6JBD9_9BACT|nr:RagB/SusD family nutrient uptake outer membrane protein [Chitinophaga horti]UYQ95499.1 RagB/SusD family nutrient uptake outer membrane protein [Chitinophaga horti]
MRNKAYHIFSRLAAIVAIGSLSLTSCKKFLEIGTPANAVSEEGAFADSATATSTVLTLYTQAANTNPQNTSVLFNVTKYGMMSADEAYYLTNSLWDNFRNNTLASGNDLQGFWAAAYTNIGRTNYIITNLEAESKLTPTVRNQLLGEAKFWRAWHYFYLTSYFGAAPLVLNTDALTNAQLPRSTAADVYAQIVKDLTEAKAHLTDIYPSAERARVNRKVAAAMLARVRFYQQNWPEAEKEAGEVLGTTGTYRLVNGMDSVFIRTSPEVILQAANVTGVTSFGAEFIPAASTPNVVLYDTLARTFEPGDKRKAQWTRPITFSGKEYFYPYKYRVRAGTAANEYAVMLRLAEMFLIRSEARANQDRIGDAVDDINAVRQRAGINGLAKTIDKTTLLAALEHERWVELFTEYGDRWLNLKRTGRADVVLPLIKPAYTATQKLYPLPTLELQANPKLAPDNPGYN